MLNQYDDHSEGLVISVTSSSKSRWYRPRVHVLTKSNGQVESIYMDSTLWEAWQLIRWYKRRGWRMA